MQNTTYNQCLDVLGIPVGLDTDDESILDVVLSSFSYSNESPKVIIQITVGSHLQDSVKIDLKNGLVTVHFNSVRDLDGYGYHNATKWLIRAACWIHETQGTISLHAAGFSLHGKGCIIAGRTYYAGKTTLALHALEAGGRYTTDEYLLYDGYHCFGEPSLKCHIRLGTLYSFSRLQHFVPRQGTASSSEELWKDEFSHAVDLSIIYSEDQFIFEFEPRFLFISELDPKSETNVDQIPWSEALQWLYLQSIKHLSKLWLQPGQEIGLEGFKDADLGLADLGLSNRSRYKVLKNLAKRLLCFNLVGGKNIQSVFNAIEHVVQLEKQT